MKYLKNRRQNVRTGAKADKILKMEFWNIASNNKGKWVDLTGEMNDVIRIQRAGRLVRFFEFYYNTEWKLEGN